MSGDAMDSLGYALEESDTARATWRGTAEHLVEHYPDVLLAALAEAGVLRGERHWSVVVGTSERYVTEWRPTDHRPDLPLQARDHVEDQ